VGITAPLGSTFFLLLNLFKTAPSPAQDTHGLAMQHGHGRALFSRWDSLPSLRPPAVVSSSNLPFDDDLHPLGVVFHEFLWVFSLPRHRRTLLQLTRFPTYNECFFSFRRNNLKVASHRPFFSCWDLSFEGSFFIPRSLF